MDTDEDIRGTVDGHEAVAEVDTDEDLRRAQESSSHDRAAYCLWGSYQPARVKTVQQGMYHVRYDDGATRWTTCGELVLGDQRVPPRWLQPGAPILRPEAEESSIDFATPASTVRARPIPTPDSIFSHAVARRRPIRSPLTSSPRAFPRHRAQSPLIRRPHVPEARGRQAAAGAQAARLTASQQGHSTRACHSALMRWPRLMFRLRSGMKPRPAAALSTCGVV